MEKWISEEVSNLVYESPVPFFKFDQNWMVAALKNIEMGLWKTSSSEKSL